MSSPKHTILIIGAAWHTPKSYTKLTTALEASGFEVHIPSHPSMNGSRPPNGNLETDTAHIRSYTEDLLKDGRLITVLMHSYGGHVGTNALGDLGTVQRSAAGLSGGVAHLIYMTAACLSEGLSMIDMVKHFDHEVCMHLFFDFENDMLCVNHDAKKLLVGANSGLSDPEIDEYLSTLVPWNGTCYYLPLTTPRAAWRDIPVTYIYTTKDLMIPLDYQIWLVDCLRNENKVKVQTTTLETSHCPNLVAPDKVAEIVARVTRGEKLDPGNAEEGVIPEGKSKRLWKRLWR